MSSISGRGWSFPLRLGDRGGIAMAQDDADIREAIRIILNTAPGERVMRPDFGCNIHDLVFWPANDQTAAIIERNVVEALSRWEPRIRLINVNARVPDTGDLENEEWSNKFLSSAKSSAKGDHPKYYGQIWIEIEYEIKDRHDIRSLVYPFYLIPS